MNIETFKNIIDNNNLSSLSFTDFEFKVEVFHSLTTNMDMPNCILLASNQHTKMRIGYIPYFTQARFSKSENERFSMRDYVIAKKIMPIEEFENIFHRHGSESEEQYLQRTLEFIIEFVQKHLSKFVDGTTWEDIPLDWFGYK